MSDPNNPPTVSLPTTGDEIATAGTAEAALGTDATGGDVPFLTGDSRPNRRLWSYDKPLNTADRQSGEVDEHPDCVEHA